MVEFVFKKQYLVQNTCVSTVLPKSEVTVETLTLLNKKNALLLCVFGASFTVTLSYTCCSSFSDGVPSDSSEAAKNASPAGQFSARGKGSMLLESWQQCGSLLNRLL